ncbi:MAG: MFS transporter [Anaerovoracaceae bacterium]
MNRSEEKEQKSTLRVCIATAFISTFMGSALNLAIPNIGEAFDVSAALVGWVITAYMLSVAAMSVPFGKIADTTGRRRIFLLGIFFFGFTGIISIFAWNIWLLIVCRVLQGLAGAMIFATNTAILLGAFPGSQRGNVLGKMTASTYVGLAAGPVAGGMLNHYFGWQSIFIISFVVSMVAFITALRHLPKQEQLVTEGKQDIIGNSLYVMMILLIMYGFSSVMTLTYGWAIIVAGILVGVLFTWVELRAKNPVIHVRIFKHNLVYTLSNLAALLNYGATFAIGYLMSIYLQVVMGYSSQTSGLILIAQPVIMALLSPAMGRLSDKIAPYKLASLGMALCTLSLIFFATVSIRTPLWAIILALVVTGLGFALFSSPNTNAVMACVEKKDYSIASSILATMRSLGHTSSMAIVTLVVAISMGNTQLSKATPEMLIKTMHIGFTIFTVLCFLGVLMSLKRKSS